MSLLSVLSTSRSGSLADDSSLCTHPQRKDDTAAARLRLVHRDETHLAILSADDEVFAELGLAGQRPRKCYETAACSVLGASAEKMWTNITFERRIRKGGVHLRRHRTRDHKQRGGQA